jgi:hypothetical protein
VDGVVCCGGFAIDVYGEVVGFPCYCSVQNIDVVVDFMGWVKLDVADVLKPTNSIAEECSLSFLNWNSKTTNGYTYSMWPVTMVSLTTYCSS